MAFRPQHSPAAPDAAAPAGSAVPGRREGIDVARILALLVVVLGHLMLAVVDRPGDEVRGANLLALHPGWALVAAAAPMPVFFAAGGWANATAAWSSAVPRLRTLVGLGAVAVVVWSAASVVTALVNDGDSGIVGDGARIATQPLWFLAAYVPFAAAGKPLAALARRMKVVLPAVLATLAVLDVARFALDAPQWIGWPGFFLAWGTPWLLGAWWRHQIESSEQTGGGDRFDERRAGRLLAGAAALACVGLVHLAGYSPALIDAVPGARSNTTPPTLYTAVAGVAQVGVLMAAGGLLDRAGERWRRLWRQAGEAAVGIYVWHLSALTLCVAAIAAGFPVPDRLTPLWWITRPLWWAAVLAITAGFVAATAAVRSKLPQRPKPAADDAPARLIPAAAGVALAVAGAALVGLRGPRHPEQALACAALFLAAWWLLGQVQSQVQVRHQTATDAAELAGG
jgi:hypothetical protein